MNNFGAYIHARPDGEAFYVGKGKPRRAQSLCARNQHHGRIVAKYGRDNIIVDFVPCESESAAFALEIEWIRTLRLFGVKLTNMTDGGEGASGCFPTEETRAKLSAASKGHKRRLGSKQSEAARAKNAAAQMGNLHLLGHKHSEETKAKIGASNIGRKHSEESKAKRSAALKGKKLSAEHCAKLSLAQCDRWAKRKLVSETNP